MNISNKQLIAFAHKIFADAPEKGLSRNRILDLIFKEFVISENHVEDAARILKMMLFHGIVVVNEYEVSYLDYYKLVHNQSLEKSKIIVDKYVSRALRGKNPTLYWQIVYDISNEIDKVIDFKLKEFNCSHNIVKT